MLIEKIQKGKNIDIRRIGADVCANLPSEIVGGEGETRYFHVTLRYLQSTDTQIKIRVRFWQDVACGGEVIPSWHTAFNEIQTFTLPGGETEQTEEFTISGPCDEEATCSGVDFNVDVTVMDMNENEIDSVRCTADYYESVSEYIELANLTVT